MTQAAAVKPTPLRSPPGEEELRFIRNFHDVFLSIGLAMFAVGLGIVTFLLLGDALSKLEGAGWRGAAGLIAGALFVDAAIMWALGEVFARSRRLFLPAIVILLAFIAFWSWGLVALYAVAFLNVSPESLDLSQTWRDFKAFPLFITGGVAAGIFVYYLRMKLPFAMGLGALWLSFFGVAVVFWINPDLIVQHYLWLHLAAGLFLFVLGVAFDARDPLRLTRYSDNGFWLHFFAAPLIFGAVLGLVSGQDAVARAAVAADAFPAAATLLVVIAFAVVSLLINRRALLVAGLLSAAFSIAFLVSRAGLDGAWTAAVTLLVLGGAMVLLGGAWHGVRRVLIAPFPKTGPIARIIPPEPPKEGAVSE